MDINGCAEAHRESDFCVSDKRPYAKSNYNERRRRSILDRLTAYASPSLGQYLLKKLDNGDSSSSVKQRLPEVVGVFVIRSYKVNTLIIN